MSTSRASGGAGGAASGAVGLWALIMASLLAQSLSHPTHPRASSTRPGPPDRLCGAGKIACAQQACSAPTCKQRHTSSMGASASRAHLAAGPTKSSTDEQASTDAGNEDSENSRDAQEIGGSPCHGSASQSSSRRSASEFGAGDTKRQEGARALEVYVNKNKRSFLSDNRARQNNEQELIELLAQLYAHTQELKDKVNIYLFQRERHRLAQDRAHLNHSQASKQDHLRLEKAMGADQESLLKWLRDKQSNFSSLKSTKFELLSEVPNRSIIVCQDGPKILVLPNVSDIVHCYTRDQWIERLWLDIKLLPVHYPIIVLSALIFFFGTTGNVFVCLSVYRNHQLRNVTNYFIVNLAVADLLVILICLPATVIWDVSLTWFFGTIGCKLIMFLQDVSVSVSVLTLTAISLDRYNAICHPLKFKSNLNQAKRVIITIWLASLAIMSPDLLYLAAYASSELTEAGLDTVLYSDCDYNLTRDAALSFQFVKTILLYLLPFLLMFCTHFRILNTLREASNYSGAHDDADNSIQLANSQLWRNRPLNDRCRSYSKSLSIMLSRNTTTETLAMSETNAGLREPQGVVVSPMERAQSVHESRSRSKLSVSMHNQARLDSRRKAAKMLTAIVVLFGLCYLPVHLINSLRQFIDDIPQTDATSSISMLAHCICYLNSAINPIIYNYMNSVFRAEFKKFLSCCSSGARLHVAPVNSARCPTV